MLSFISANILFTILDMPTNKKRCCRFTGNTASGDRNLDLEISRLLLWLNYFLEANYGFKHYAVEFATIVLGSNIAFAVIRLCYILKLGHHVFG